MPKRNRDHDVGQDTEVQGSGLGRQSSNFREILESSTKSLASALKLARGFERQKLGRRQKQASKAPQNLLRLREEVILLKQLDLDKTASNYLVKHLSKAKRVRESPIFEATYGPDPQLETVRPGAEANVVGRLVNSTPAKQAMTQIMETVYKTLGLKDAHTASKGSVQASERTQSRVESAEVQDDMSFRGFSPASSTSGSLVDLQSDSETGDELTEGHQQRVANSDSKNYASPSSYSGSVSRSPSPASKPTSRSNVVTSFIPALSMGGYYSGSDSGEDDEAATTEPRKNRRGQRARQQLAELKYGKNARHLQQQDAKSSRNAGWDAQRGAIDRSDQRRKGQSGDYGARGPVFKSSKANNAAEGVGHAKQKPTSRDDGGSLHPSWEAAKLRKNLMADQAKFSGKKITFD